METSRQSSPARLAAILALIAALVALLLVIGSSLGGDSSDQGGNSATGRIEKRNANQKQRKIYVVKPGDSLSTIAEKVGIPVEDLQQLNPEIDPQALRSGERVKLR